MPTRKIVGWILSCLLAAFLLLGSASGKIIGGEAAARMFDHIGWTPSVMYCVGFAEIAFVVLFLVPRTAFFGVVLLTAYFGAAAAAHIRVDDAYVVPIAASVLTWIALGLRDPRVFPTAFGSPTAAEAVPSDRTD